MKKTLILLPTFLGQNGKSLNMTWRLKKNCSKLLVHQRHSLTNQVITPCWSQYSCLIWLSFRWDARDTKGPRVWLKAMKWCEKISRFRPGMRFEFERQFVCPLHVVSRISSEDAPADGYSSIKIAMIKQNVWWTMFPVRFLFPSPQASTRPRRGLCGGERSLTFAATFPQNASCNTGTQVRVTVKSNKTINFKFVFLVTPHDGWSPELVSIVTGCSNSISTPPLPPIFIKVIS